MKFVQRAVILLILLVVLTMPVAAQEGTPEPTSPVSPNGNTAIQTVNEPTMRDFSEDLLQQLHVPPGFHVSVFAKGLENPRIMVQNTDGTIYISQRTANNVLALKDTNGDGVSDQTRVVADNINLAHGLALRDNQLYIMGDTKLYVADINTDGSLTTPKLLADDLPESGQHSARTLAFGPDGMLYIQVGSPCNACSTPNPEHAAILRAAPDLSQRSVFASGLRHSIGFAWDPQTGELWAMDQGIDALGDDNPPEELNKIVEGQNYGWPWCFGDRQVNEFLPGTPNGMTKEQFCAASTPPVLSYQAHSSPIGFVFYTGSQFPGEYQNDAFVAFRGSWDRGVATGYKVVRIHFQDGQPTGFEDFLTGFLIDNGTAQFARLAGLLVLPDGSLLVADDSGGIIYRVSYDGA